jgi:hypothetical protein
MSETPGALQLRLLQTVVDVAAEKNSTLVMPFPVELLRFFERATINETPATAAPAGPQLANGHRATLNTAAATTAPAPRTDPAPDLS